MRLQCVGQVLGPKLPPLLIREGGEESPPGDRRGGRGCGSVHS